MILCDGSSNVRDCFVPYSVVFFISLIALESGITIEGLFGEYCTGNEYHHDVYMAQLAAKLPIDDSEHHQSQTSLESAASEDSQRLPRRDFAASGGLLSHNETSHSNQVTTALLPIVHGEIVDEPTTNRLANSQQQTIDLTHDAYADRNALFNRETSMLIKRPYSNFAGERQSTMDCRGTESTIEDSTSHLIDSQGSSISERRLETRRDAFNAMMGDPSIHHTWNGLLSTTNNHTRPDSELGEG